MISTRFPEEVWTDKNKGEPRIGLPFIFIDASAYLTTTLTVRFAAETM